MRGKSRSSVTRSVRIGTGRRSLGPPASHGTPSRVQHATLSSADMDRHGEVLRSIVDAAFKPGRSDPAGWFGPGGVEKIAELCRELAARIRATKRANDTRRASGLSFEQLTAMSNDEHRLNALMQSIELVRRLPKFKNR